MEDLMGPRTLRALFGMNSYLAELVRYVVGTAVLTLEEFGPN